MMKEDAFPVGFWHSNPIPPLKECEKMVRDWADAGGTVIRGPFFSIDNPEECGRMEKVLSLCGEAGIRVLLHCNEACYETYMSQGEAYFRQKLKSALDLFSRYPAVYGFYLGDEPTKAAFEAVCGTYAAYRDIAGGSGLVPYINLFPWFFDSPEFERISDIVGFDRWEDYIEEYIKAARPSILSFDCYSQMLPDRIGWDMFFKNLKDFSSASLKHDIPFWTVLLASPHWLYKEPSEDELRWQLNAAVCHGAKGIMWYTFTLKRSSGLDSNFRMAPINEFNERTEMFYRLSHVLRLFHATEAPLIKGLKFIRAKHYLQSYGGFEIFQRDEIISAVESQPLTPLAISYFKGKDESIYISVFNNSNERSTKASVYLRPPYKAQICGMNASFSSCGAADPRSGMTVLTEYLAPGQMYIFKLYEKT